MSNRQERRKYRRIETPFMARFRVKQFEGVGTPLPFWEPVTIKNISAGGTYFYYKMTLGLDSLLYLKIYVPTCTSVINCVGKITRIDEPKANTMFRIAIEFKEIDEREKEKINTIAREALL